jgi:hypothetical protein
MPGLPNANYWSAEVKYSENGRYLWATARAQANRTDLTGWINIWELDTCISPSTFICLY